MIFRILAIWILLYMGYRVLRRLLAGGKSTTARPGANGPEEADFEILDDDDRDQRP